jgi:WD40 repeat protein
MPDTGRPADKKLKIFISYSRKNIDFAEKLAAALKTWGAETLIDSNDIYALEDWWTRIQILIRQADTMIFIISPDAIASKVCPREIAFAASLNKRLAPIVYRRVELDKVPQEISQLNFIFFDEEVNFDGSLARLTDALSTNIAWVRRHTEFGVDSRNWDAARRPNGLLLRSPLLEEAEQWIASRPDGAPEPTAETRDFILQSRVATTRRRNYLIGSLAAGLLIALGLAGLAYWQSTIADRERRTAEQQRNIAVDRRDDALRSESRFLAEHSRQKLEAGDATGAAHIALAALPDADEKRDRPLVSIAQSALYHALTGPRELSMAPLRSIGGIAKVLPSPDQKQLLAFTSGPGFVTPQVWNLPNIELTASLPAHLEGVVAAFIADGTKVITQQKQKSRPKDPAAKQPGSAESTTAPPDSDLTEGLVRVFDAKTGTRTHALGTFDSLSVTKAGDRFVTAKGGTLTLWDGRTVTPTRTFDLPTTEVFSGLFGNDRLVRFRVSGGEMRNLDLTTGAITKDSEADKRPAADDAEQKGTLSPDGSRLVTGKDYKGHLKISLHAVLPEKKLIAELESGDGAGRFQAVFSSDSRLLATTGGGNQAKIWDAQTGKLVHALKGHGGPVLSVAFIEQSGSLLTTSADESIRMWSVATGEPVLALTGHLATRAYVSDNGKRLLSVGNGSIRLWGLDDATTVVSFDPALTVQAKTIRSSQDHSRLLLGTADEQSLYVVTASSPTPVRQIKLAPPGVPDWCTPTTDAGQPAKDGAPVERSEAAPVGQSADAKPRREFRFSNNGGRLVAANAPAGKPDSSATSFRQRCVWDLDTGRLIEDPTDVLSHDTPGDQDANMRSNDERLDLEPVTLLLSEADSLQVYDLRARRVVSTLKATAGPPRSWQFYEDSALLLVGRDEVLRVFDPRSGELLSTITAPGRKVDDARLASQGRRLFIKWRDPDPEDIRKPNLDLYDAATGKLIKSYSIGYGRTYFSRRRSFAVIPTAVNKNGGADGAMQLVDATSGEKIHEISFWHPQLGVRDVSEDGRLVFLTTDYRKRADGNSIVVDFESNRVVATFATGIISDGGLYMNGRRAWTRAGRSTWGRGLEYPVTIWDVEKQHKIVEIAGDISNVRVDRSETLVFLQHTNGTLEGRNSLDGHQLFSTNAKITEVKRAYFMNGRRALMLLIDDATQPGKTDEDKTLRVSEIRLLDIPPNDVPRIAEAKRKVPRCLTPQQLEGNFLPKEPPTWCIEMAKWPYDTDEWRQWLAQKRSGENPGMPDGPPHDLY